MTDDSELLRRYVTERSEAAFAAIVQRHLDLVYRAALRRLAGHSHRAQDVSQVVFADLARKAPALAGRASLAGWLFLSTQHACAALMRGEQRREAREEAWTMNELRTGGTSEPDDLGQEQLARLRATLENALLELRPPDREAILLRFFEQRAFADIGSILRLKEDAVRRRVERALKRLREVLGKRGLRSTELAIAACLSTETFAAAPAAFAAAVTQSAVAAAAAGGAVSGAAGIGVWAFMGTTKYLAGSAIAALLLISAAGVAIEAIRYGRLHTQLASAQANRFAQLRRLDELEHLVRTSALSDAPPPRALAPKHAPSLSDLLAVRRESINNAKAIQAAHPEVRAAWIGMMRANVLQRYHGQLAALGVPADKLNRFCQIEEPRLVLSMEELGTLFTFESEPIEKGVAPWGEEAELQTLLGPAVYDQVKAYEQAQPSRETVSTFAGMALASGDPLSSAQVGALTQAIQSDPTSPRVQAMLNPDQIRLFAGIQAAATFKAQLQASTEKAAQLPVAR